MKLFNCKEDAGGLLALLYLRRKYKIFIYPALSSNVITAVTIETLSQTGTRLTPKV
jgi:hypothetical protein